MDLNPTPQKSALKIGLGVGAAIVFGFGYLYYSFLQEQNGEEEDDQSSQRPKQAGFPSLYKDKSPLPKAQMTTEQIHLALKRKVRESLVSMKMPFSLFAELHVESSMACVDMNDQLVKKNRKTRREELSKDRQVYFKLLAAQITEEEESWLNMFIEKLQTFGITYNIYSQYFLRFRQQVPQKMAELIDITRRLKKSIKIDQIEKDKKFTPEEGLAFFKTVVEKYGDENATETLPSALFPNQRTLVAFRALAFDLGWTEHDGFEEEYFSRVPGINTHPEFQKLNFMLTQKIQKLDFEVRIQMEKESKERMELAKQKIAEKNEQIKENEKLGLEEVQEDDGEEANTESLIDQSPVQGGSNNEEATNSDLQEEEAEVEIISKEEQTTIQEDQAETNQEDNELTPQGIKNSANTKEKEETNIEREENEDIHENDENMNNQDDSKVENENTEEKKNQFDQEESPKDEKHEHIEEP